MLKQIESLKAEEVEQQHLGEGFLMAGCKKNHWNTMGILEFSMKNSVLITYLITCNLLIHDILVSIYDRYIMLMYVYV